jgi:hypothetical protein
VPVRTRVVVEAGGAQVQPPLATIRALLATSYLHVSVARVGVQLNRGWTLGEVVNHHDAVRSAAGRGTSRVPVAGQYHAGGGEGRACYSRG